MEIENTRKLELEQKRVNSLFGREVRSSQNTNDSSHRQSMKVPMSPKVGTNINLEERPR